VTEDRPEVAQSASGASATAGGASAVDLPEIAASSSVAAVLPAASEAFVSVAASAVAPAASVAKAAVAVVGAKASLPSVAASAPVGLAPVAQASATQAVARGGAKLVLTAKSPSWVEILDGNGQKLISRQLASGESTEIQGAPPLKVHAGNAPALTVVFNGQPVDLGPVTRQNVARIELK
ncbi:MAG TPA: DUF4115 domain-containing protein, partial [Aquabacterium sp.]|nr:DUF4115 domain-containing protein [Aquabacterium sp.]